MGELSTAVGTLEAAYAKAQSDLQALQSQYDATTKTYESLSTRYTLLTEERDKLKAQLDALQPATSPYRPAFFYKPTADGDPVPMQQADALILTHKDEPVMATANLNGKAAQYILSAQIASNGFGNQIAPTPAEFARLRSLYEDKARNTDPKATTIWLKYSEALAREAYAFVKKYQIPLGVFADVFLDNLVGERDQPAVMVFLKTFCELAHADGHKVLANLIGSSAFAAPISYFDYLDGYMEEGFAVDWNQGAKAPYGEGKPASGWVDPVYWRNQLARAELISSKGKDAILVSQGSKEDLARQKFAYASYLLVANDHVTFRYTNYRNNPVTNKAFYADWWDYETYHLKIGTPKTSAVQQSNGQEYVREFTNGHVLVNPTTHTADITVN